MADNNPISDELVAHLAALTNLSESRCKEYLTATNGDLEAAAQAYFADAEEAETQDTPPATTAAAASSSQSVPDNYTGPRTLDGRPAPQAIPTTSSRSAAKKPQKKTGLATLSSIGGGHAHDDEEEDDEEDFDPHDPRNTYAGGEKSGLAVQDPSQRSDPKKLLNDILAKARSNAARPEAESPGPSRASPGAFRGSGQTLGGEGTASRVIPDPNAPPAQSGSSRSRPQDEQVQERTLHLWQDGFSIDDGELRRFDDPANTDALRMIQQGRAPVHLMNVRPNEPLDVKLQQHAENWKPLPKVYKPFGGSGRRLGSPVPGDASAAASASASTTLSTPSTSNTAAAAPSAAAPPPSNAVNESQPTVSIRIQMPDGARLPARFNTTHTVGDIYDFIARASPELRAGGWVLATTFPNKDHTDKSLVLGDLAEFKKGGTAVVKRST
ncbi:protein phosphatase regulator [Diatrype stigma]|uniref:Protein phosphatase regulator n=1 Tax=Diatrype stigma TaxID=117547 RepID=A0AAN9UTB9_9PEZI